MWKTIFNKGSHIGIGVYAGYYAEEPRGWVATGIFGAYQTTEVWTKGDKGYPEWKEFGIGYAGGRLLRRWHDSRNKSKQTQDTSQSVDLPFLKPNRCFLCGEPADLYPKLLAYFCEKHVGDYGELRGERCGFLGCGKITYKQGRFMPLCKDHYEIQRDGDRKN